MYRKRVVAYVRVSSASDAQLHSFEFQELYWQGKFENDPDTELITIYADKGISGSSIRKRPQFKLMLQDAREGKFDVIHTKSVSRFARNTVELLETVRELRELGIEVVFEKEQISTMQPTSELFLTVAATIAENDLKVDSERQRWSIRRRYENGWISIGNGMYGYRMTRDNNLEIVPEQADVIRRIFNMYIEGYGYARIAKTLKNEGEKHWAPNSIQKILDNEKYMGDTVMGKSVCIDGKRYDNRNNEYGPKYYMENTHEGIISAETFKKAQELRKKRRNDKLIGREVPTYTFSGLIECGICHAKYNHKVNNSGKKWRSDIWCCATAIRKGVAVCDCTRIKDSVLKEKFIEAYNQFVREKPQGEDVTVLRAEISRLQGEENELAGLLMQKLITETAFRDEQRRIKMEIKGIRIKLNERIGKTVRESDFTEISEFNNTKVEKFISKVIMHKNMVTFVFYNGVRISRKYSNGQPGNRVGWNNREG